MDELEEEKKGSHGRIYSPAVERVITGIAVVMVIYHIGYVSSFFDWVGIFIDPAIHMAIHLCFMIPMVFLLVPATKHSPKSRLPLYDAVLIALVLLWNGYMIWNFDNLYGRSVSGYLSPFENVMVWVNIILMIEASRRVAGWALSGTAIVFVLYVFAGPYLPSFLEIPYFEPSRIGRSIGLFVTGMYGSILLISATLLIIYMLLGEFLQASGAGAWFIDIANALLGRFRGGPAKGAVMASSLFGMVSGSGIANTATVGVITIPLMKKAGYSAQFSAGVEAAASNGGQIMPPVMGVAAFIMADFLGMSYSKIALIGVLPAVLYYIALFIMVDMESVRLGLKAMPREDVPKLWETIKEGWQFILPLSALAYLLIVLLYSPEKSALYAIAILFIITLFKKKGHGRIGLKKLTEICRRTLHAMLLIVTMCGVGGIVIGAVSMSGLGYRLSTGLVDLSGGNLFLLAVYAAIACLLLGLNLPTSVVYLIGAILIAPAFTAVDVSPIVAHFFIFFYGVSALITPPVCETAFIAAGIAGAHPMRTGFTAMRLASTSLIIPFFFLANPALLLQGSVTKIILTVLLSIVSIVFSSFGFSGYFLHKANWLERCCLVAGGLLMLYMQWLYVLLGLALISVGVISQVLKRRANIAAGATA